MLNYVAPDYSLPPLDVQRDHPGCSWFQAFLLYPTMTQRNDAAFPALAKGPRRAPRAPRARCTQTLRRVSPRTAAPPFASSDSASSSTCSAPAKRLHRSRPLANPLAGRRRIRRTAAPHQPSNHHRSPGLYLYTAAALVLVLALHPAAGADAGPEFQKGIPLVPPSALYITSPCGEAGYGTERVQASIDYVLCCRAMGTQCCQECKCQWAQYYEEAMKCFEQYGTYAGLLVKDVEKWNKAAKLNCKISEEMATLYASQTANDIWRAEHMQDANVLYQNLNRADKRQGTSPGEEKEWCGGAMQSAPSLLLLLICSAVAVAAFHW